LRKVALLLDQAENPYQELLSKEARVRARHRGVELLEPRFADGSAMVQMQQIFECAGGETGPAGVMLVLAGGQSQPACRRLVAAGVSLVFLNRVPDYLDDLRSEAKNTLVSAVAPDQVEIGRLQGEFCTRLLRAGGTVLLVTGTPDSASAVARKEGFREAVGPKVQVHVAEGQWTEESGQQAVASWLRLAMGRDSALGLVVCQNDLMAKGARRALVKHAAGTGHKGLGQVPIVGCDGLRSEGQRMVDDGELAATVILPPTTGRAIDMLAAFWEVGSRSDLVLLPPDSYPQLGQLKLA
jgi:ABC-type sugar transport system substrate-binding protein